MIMQRKSTAPGQINSLDILKFIMAVAVVVLHVGALYGEPCVYGPAVCWFENLAVPFFFISSGYLIGRHISAQTSADSKAYLRGKSRRYLRLFVVWSLIYLPVSLVLYSQNATIGVKTVFDYVGRIALMGDFEGVWFIWYLYSSVFVYFLLSLCDDIRGRVWLYAVFFVVIYIIGQTVGMMGLPKYPDIIVTGVCTRVLGGGVYIVAGMLLYRYRRFAVNVGVSAGLLAVSICLFAICGRFYQLFGGVALALLAMSVRVSGDDFCRQLRYLSMWIYFLHMYVMDVFIACGLVSDNAVTTLAWIAGLTVALSLAVNWATSRYKTLAPLRRLLG